MAGFLTYTNGQLKTSRVAALVFTALLTVLALVFYINKSIDYSLVAVTHVFEPEASDMVEKPPATSRNTELSEPEKPKTAEHTPTMDSRDAPERAREAKRLPGIQKRAERAPPETAFPVNAEQNVKEQEVKMEKDHVKAADTVPPDDPHPPRTENTETTKSKAQRDRPVKSMNRHEETAKQEKSSPGTRETISPVDDLPDVPAKIALPSLQEKVPEAEPLSSSIDIAEKVHRLTAKDDRPRHHDLPHRSQAVETANLPVFDTSHGVKEITVDHQQYMKLFHSWRTSGNGAKDTKKIPLRVENLRNTFALFQMKPIAVINGHAFLDLTDGTRVTEQSLDEYSTTVFQVRRPRDTWREALTAAGIGQKDRVEIRYYMYDFVRNAIYNRANQAVSWCKDQGLIQGDLPASDIDVLGRAYVINQHGGGRFGVVVPVSIDIKDGKTVAVDPICLRGQPDVEVLLNAGLL
jgi:hypothetical protein